MSVVCYLSLGSNLGNRREKIKDAISKINLLPKTKVLKQSKFISTDPIGGPANQPRFINAALKIYTSLSPTVLLKSFKTIEKDLGREKNVPNGPRKIDLDILLYADKVINLPAGQAGNKGLTIPHPRMFEREFVIKPLSEVIC